MTKLVSDYREVEAANQAAFKAWEERMAVKRAQEEEQDRLAAAKLQSAYLARTGRTEMKP
jgi:hypothetical protein